MVCAPEFGGEDSDVLKPNALFQIDAVLSHGCFVLKWPVSLPWPHSREMLYTPGIFNPLVLDRLQEAGDLPQQEAS
jgi:hypothetical protein